MRPWRLVLGWVRAMYPLCSPWVTASAPDTPMRKTLASTHRGLMARVTAEAQVATMATTLLTSISLRAARTPASALVWSSSWKSWMVRPLIPPALLIRSTTATTERCISGPYEPPAPVRGHSVPMGMGSFDCPRRPAGMASRLTAPDEAASICRRVNAAMSASQIQVSNLRIVQERGPGAFGPDLSHREHVAAVTEGERG